MKATATELNKHPGKYLNQAIKEPVIIEKAGHPVAVMVSYERYLMLEDAYWGELANLADKDKTLGVKKSMDFLLGDE
ncbi:MAG: type II toxin-antitoxin system Phd/YefM family antitoxin [Proteobacteria bacterium]|jgi:prevent-host-death family protein|nr:type II toxin-antitoxin system Phd/YefM family antitoxin [Pseudomonadota bacterium]